MVIYVMTISYIYNHYNYIIMYMDYTMNTIAIANQKGGVGKTTTVLNLASELAKNGDRVLMVDADPQSTLTLSLGASDEHLNLAHVLGITERGTGDLKAIIKPVSENLDIAPGDILMSRTEIGLVVRPARELQLKRTLEGVTNYRWIIIDAPPSLSLITVNVLLASDHVIVPMQLSTFDLRGVNLFLETLEDVQSDYGHCAQLCGVLATQVDLRTLHAKDVLTVLQERPQLRLFEATIPASIRFKESVALGQPINEYEPNHAGATAYANLAQEIIKRVKKTR